MSQYIAKYDEKFVNNTILYVDDIADNEYLYHDPETTASKKVSRKELLALLEKGPIVIYCSADSTWVKPMVFVDGGTSSYVSAKIISLTSATPAVASYVTFVTKEYTAG